MSTSAKITTEAIPVEIVRESEVQLRVVWSDSRTQLISGRTLRESCPCATCGEARGDLSHDRPLVPKVAAPKGRAALKIVENDRATETAIVRVWAVGRYALGVEFADGHNTGIYTYRQLYATPTDES